MGTRSAWTPERRARQREIIRVTKPWTRSTGPRSKLGKGASSRNAEHFRRDPEMRKAYLLIRDFFKTGQMSAELGEIFLKADLSGPLADTIYEDGGFGFED